VQVSQSGTTGLNGPPPRQWPPEGNDQVLLLYRVYRVYSSFNIDAPLRSAGHCREATRASFPSEADRAKTIWLFHGLSHPAPPPPLQTSMYSTYCKSTVSADTSTSTRERSRDANAMPVGCLPPTEGRARTRKSMGEWEACQWRHLIAICNKFDSRRTRRECGWPFNAEEFRFRFRLRFRFRGRVSQSASSKFESPLHFIPPARYYYQLQGTKILNLST